MPRASASHTDPVFRIDKFVVPAEALPEVVAQIKRVHAVLDGMPGCLRHRVLSQTGGSGEFNVINYIEWADADAIAAAIPMVRQLFEREGFDPTEFVKRFGVRADMGFYGEV
ncbi:MAG: antibiotic biosynthesis monooxygenase [Pandoraea sp.]|nr:MAG: antibiotic biosynthesis monooxygenase [Pandoraea sp.]TAM15522.1 MAG: antibiotic biosynthesis monooxygenase [Pandoraea sp.]